MPDHELLRELGTSMTGQGPMREWRIFGVRCCVVALVAPLLVVLIPLIALCAWIWHDPAIPYPPGATASARTATHCQAQVCGYEMTYSYTGGAATIVQFYEAQGYTCQPYGQGESGSLAYDIDGASWFCDGDGEKDSDITLGFPRIPDDNTVRTIVVQTTINWDNELFPSRRWHGRKI